MKRIQAQIKGDGVDTSVEFSLEEVIAHQESVIWSELNDEQQLAAIRDYALMLYSRQTGDVSNLQVEVDPEVIHEPSGMTIQGGNYATRLSQKGFD